MLLEMAIISYTDECIIYRGPVWEQACEIKANDLVRLLSALQRLSHTVFKW